MGIADVKRVTDHIREHLLASLGYAEPPRRMPDLDELRATEWCDAFDVARRYRMLIGAFRYGLLSDPAKWRYDFLGGLRKKLDHYRRTGNTESLVDASNYLMLEFMRPSHPAAHFRAEDDHCHCPAALP